MAQLPSLTRRKPLEQLRHWHPRSAQSSRPGTHSRAPAGIRPASCPADRCGDRPAARTAGGRTRRRTAEPGRAACAASRCRGWRRRLSARSGIVPARPAEAAQTAESVVAQAFAREQEAVARPCSEPLANWRATCRISGEWRLRNSAQAKSARPDDSWPRRFPMESSPGSSMPGDCLFTRPCDGHGSPISPRLHYCRYGSGPRRGKSLLANTMD